MLTSSVTEQLSGTRRLCDSPRLLHDQVGCRSRVGTVLEETLERSGEHLLKANNKHAVRGAVGNHVPAHVETSGSGRTVVVDVVDRDTGHAELVENALSTRRVAITVACYALVDVVVVDVCIEHSLHASLEAELRVIDLATRLDKLHIVSLRSKKEILNLPWSCPRRGRRRVVSGQPWWRLCDTRAGVGYKRHSSSEAECDGTEVMCEYKQEQISYNQES
jgi:hypothetical protein